MNYHHRYCAKQVIRFNRWCNTSYAVFNSIGKVVLIGKLSKIISGLVTAKSIVSKRLAYLIEVFYTEKEPLTENLEHHIIADELLVRDGGSFCDMSSVFKSQKASVSEISIIRNQQKYQKASKGLFSFVELALIWIIRHFFTRIKILKQTWHE